MAPIRVIYSVSRYWRCYLLLIFATFLSFILIFISQNDPQLEHYFPYFKLGTKYYYDYFINNGDDMSKFMENNTLDYQYLYSNSRICLNPNNMIADLNNDGNFPANEDEDEIKIVFLCISQVNNFKSRQAARQTYGKYLHKMKLKLIFFVGNSNYDDQKHDANQLQSKLDKEINENLDIVQINMPDSDNFTSAKTLIALKWSTTYCLAAKYLYVISDAAIINYDFLSKLITKTSLFGADKIDKPLKEFQSYNQQINNSVIVGYCNSSDEKLADTLNTFFKNYLNKILKQQQEQVATSQNENEKSTKKKVSLPDQYKGQYCSGLGWLVSRQAAQKLWFTALRSPYIARIVPAYLTGYLGYKANLKYLNLFEYEEMIPIKSNCLKVFQMQQNKLLCAENFTIHNRYANYIATWNTGGSDSQLALSKL